MSFVVQKVDWFQLRAPDGQAILVMVQSLPNGFVTAVPCQVSMTLASHGLMALAASPDEALAQLQQNLAGKTVEEIFPAQHG